MPEATSNVEFAHKIHEHGHHHSSPADRRVQRIEILEAVVLAIVAVVTAWSGYQAAKWDALSAQHYSLALRTTVLSEEKATLAGQDRLYDITTFSAWADATLAGRDKLAAFYWAQKKYTETRDALERSTAIRARFLALGISQQATQAFTEGQTQQVKAFYRRGLAVLEPPNPINDDLREQFEGMLKALDAPPPKSATPPKKAATSQKKTSKL